MNEKPDRKEYVLYNTCFAFFFFNEKSSIVTEMRSVVALGHGRGRERCGGGEHEKEGQGNFWA